MADERYPSAVRSMGDKLENTASQVATETKTELKDLGNQAAGVVQDVYGKTKSAATDGAEAVKDAAVASHDFLKRFMDDNPHTTTAIALGLGLLIGYAARGPAPRRDRWF